MEGKLVRLKEFQANLNKTQSQIDANTHICKQTKKLVDEFRNEDLYRKSKDNYNYFKK